MLRSAEAGSQYASSVAPLLLPTRGNRDSAEELVSAFPSLLCADVQEARVSGGQPWLPTLPQARTTDSALCAVCSFTVCQGWQLWLAAAKVQVPRGRSFVLPRTAAAVPPVQQAALSAACAACRCTRNSRSAEVGSPGSPPHRSCCRQGTTARCRRAMGSPTLLSMCRALCRPRCAPLFPKDYTMLSSCAMQTLELLPSLSSSIEVLASLFTWRVNRQKRG